MSVDEKVARRLPRRRRRANIRAEVMASLDLYRAAVIFHPTMKELADSATVLRLATRYRTTKRRYPVDVDAMVAKWVDAVIGLCTSHTREQFDSWDVISDDLLKPIMRAPVAQIRKFNAKLLEALKTDPRCPFVMWSLFEAWHETMVRTATDTRVLRLKKRLAREVASIVVDDVKPQVFDALVGALQWRSSDGLKRIRKAAREGHKPVLKGRQSCLFLHVGEEFLQL